MMIVLNILHRKIVSLWELYNNGLSVRSSLLIALSPPFIQNLTYEIILTLGQAFEVAYQLALQAQRTRQQQSAAGGAEIIETKSSRPVPKPRGSMRKSGVRVRAHTVKKVKCIAYGCSILRHHRPAANTRNVPDQSQLWLFRYSVLARF